MINGSIQIKGIKMQHVYLKVLCCVLFLCVSNLSFTQVKSYAFQQPVPPGGKNVQNIDTTLFGTYKNEAGFTYVFNEEGLFSQTTLLLYISEKMVKDSTKYEVRDNYLFGVVAEDSVLCELRDGFYYYGLKDLIKLHGKGTQTTLIQSGNTYFLNYKEGNMYIPTRFIFEGKKLKVCQFDYEIETTAFDAIKKVSKVKQMDLMLLLLSPTQTEWQSLDPKAIFSETEVFLRN